MALAWYIDEPPPTAMIPSAPDALYWAVAILVCTSVGLDVVSANTPAAATPRASSTLARIPDALMPASVTMNGRVMPLFLASAASCFSAPASNTHWVRKFMTGMGHTPAETGNGAMFPTGARKFKPFLGGRLTCPAQPQHCGRPEHPLRVPTAVCSICGATDFVSIRTNTYSRARVARRADARQTGQFRALIQRRSERHHSPDCGKHCDEKPPLRRPDGGHLSDRICRHSFG